LKQFKVSTLCQTCMAVHI